MTQTDVRIQHDRPDILVIDKRRHEAVIIEIGITSQNLLKQVETQKLHEYDLLAGGVSLLYGCTTKIIPYVLSWDRILTKVTSNNWGFLVIYVGILLQKNSRGHFALCYKVTGTERIESAVLIFWELRAKELKGLRHLALK